MSKIGFIGLGRMGKGMASNLQKKGFQLTVLDVNPKPVAELVALGATAAQSVAHMAKQCTIVITMLPTATEVEQVVLGVDGVLAHAAPGTVVMDMSGSMRYGGLHVSVKRMALALQGMVLREYPGDFLQFIEMASLA